MKLFFTIIIQIIFIHIFLFLGLGVKHFIPLPIPASMIGLIILLISLKLGIVKLKWIEVGGNWLMAELLLFFIPSAVGIVKYNEIFSLQGLEMVILIGISTFIVISITAYIAEKMTSRKRDESC